MGLELLEEDVGGDLEEDVWDKEDDKGIVVLVSLEVQFLREAKNVGIGDVDSVWKLQWLV